MLLKRRLCRQPAAPTKNGHNIARSEWIRRGNRRFRMFIRKHQGDCSVGAPAAAGCPFRPTSANHREVVVAGLFEPPFFFFFSLPAQSSFHFLKLLPHTNTPSPPPQTP